MSRVDLSGVSVQDLLAELGRRCGASSQATRPGRMRYPTKEAWARAQADQCRVQYERATDPSMRASLIQDIAKYERLAATFKRKGQ